ncbi:class I adenylate-forming enzyme family protein [Streptomyces sp. NBC_00388]|uniref:class I adenylate-forming enzyme family protein n=1 Tax=Streptomyces sp. NBC_00388 TaxID=2975735 RepID=UPI002E20E2EC
MTRPATHPTAEAGDGPHAREFPFETSGSTGRPQRWFRSTEQMRREVDLIASDLVGQVDEVVSYAPPHHLFGALFGDWLPRLRGIDVHHAWADPLTPLHLRSGSRALIVCVPMTWSILHRSRSALATARSVVALHSSATAPPQARDVVAATGPHLRAHEILGSTETGGIAHRPLAATGTDTGPWHAFADVDLPRARGPVPGVQDLVVSGPRLARPQTAARPPEHWATGDLVNHLGPRTFRLAGRRGDLIKVNGRRVHLDQVAALLATRLPGADCAAIPLARGTVAGEGYAVFWTTGSTAPARIRAALSDLPGPSRLMEVPTIPRLPTGKPDRRRLLALLP